MNILNEIKRNEEIQELYSKLHYITHPNKTNIINHIIVPDPLTNGVKTIRDEEEIHKLLLEESEKSAFKHTFPDSNQCREIIGDTGEKQ